MNQNITNQELILQQILTSSQDPFANLACKEIYETYKNRVEIKNKTLIKFGANPDIDISDGYLTLWSQKTNEVFATSNSIDTVVSGNIADLEEVVIEGHTVSGNDLTFITQTINLNGTTPVSLATPLFRCTRIYNNDATPLLGKIDVYDSTSTNIHCSIVAGSQQSRKCTTSFSSQDYGLITQISVGESTKLNATVDAILEIRQFGKVFRESLRLNQGKITLTPYIIVPKNADVRLLASTSQNNTGIFGSISFLIAKII